MGDVSLQKQLMRKGNIFLTMLSLKGNFSWYKKRCLLRVISLCYRRLYAFVYLSRRFNQTLVWHPV